MRKIETSRKQPQFYLPKLPWVRSGKESPGEDKTVEFGWVQIWQLG